MGGGFGDCWGLVYGRGVDFSVKKRVLLREEYGKVIFYSQRVMGGACSWVNVWFIDC